MATVGTILLAIFGACAVVACSRPHRGQPQPSARDRPQPIEGEWRDASTRTLAAPSPLNAQPERATSDELLQSVAPQELEGAAPLYTLGEALDERHEQDWFGAKDGFVLVTSSPSNVRFWTAFSPKPVRVDSAPNFLPDGNEALDPEGKRIALLVLSKRSSIWTDLYVWSEQVGLRLVLQSTEHHPILPHHELTWSADGKWIVLTASTLDCSYQNPRTNALEQRACDRVLLIDPRNGEVAYRTPANLRPQAVQVASGKLYIGGGPRGTEDTLRDPIEPKYIGQEFSTPENRHRGPYWYEVDTGKQTLSPSLAPAHLSPDGQYRVTTLDSSLRVDATDGSAALNVLTSFQRSPMWVGPHQLAVVRLFALDLRTNKRRRLCSETCSLVAVSPDARLAIVSTFSAVGPPRNLYWASLR